MTFSPQLILDGLIILVLIFWVGYRQLRWTAVDAGRMWRMPLILGVIGIISLGGVNILGPKTGVHAPTFTGIDIAFLLIELVVSLGIGSLMGAISTIRPMSRDSLSAYHEARAASRRPSNSVVTQEARTGWLGMVLWIVFIGIRVGMGILSARMGSDLGESTGVILLMVAANRGARVGVIMYRAARIPAVVSA